ncbi:MAG: AMP-binding protein [Saccharofermentanales bacterium]
MKIAFSTLGCPEWSWDDIYSMAKDIGFDGIELRGLGSEISSYKAKPFLKDEIVKTKAKLLTSGLQIPCISSSCCIKNDTMIAKTLSEGFASIDLANQLDTPYVRILADCEPFETPDTDEAAILKSLIELSDYAAGGNVTILVETNGYYADSKKLSALMKKVGRDNVAVLWDVHHPFRFKKEPLAETYNELKQWIRYVHVKDSIIENGSIHYKMTGEGDIPVREALDMLAGDRYDGFVSLEWVKRWSADLEDAAIVFPQFAFYMERYHPKKNVGFSQTPAEQTARPYVKDILINITLGDLATKMAALYPDQEAYVFPQSNVRYTYKTFNEEVERTALGFLAIGIKKGDHVAIWATNCPQWVLTLFACAKIGAVLVTVNTSYKIHETEYIMRQSDSNTLILHDGFKDSDYLSIIKEICPEMADCRPGKLKSGKLERLKNVITLNTPLEGAFRWDELAGLGETIEKKTLTAITRSLDEHEVINMQYTSGTTGFPKGVMLTHYNIINNGKTIGDCMDFTTKDRLMVCVPLFHCFGLVLAVMASFTHGTTMVLINYFQPLPVLETLHNEKCTAMHGVPTMFIACLDHPDFKKFDLSHIRTGIMAGSPCPIKVMQDVVDKMNMSEITIVYGLTEASPGCTQTRTDDSLEKRVSTVGRALPGVECRVIDPETGLDCKVGQVGEFTARGYNIMKGYYNLPEATMSVIDKDGWLHTGDLAVVDEDGYYKITGRMKDMIIRGGENIYPKEIEEFLYTHPDVKDVQVVGVPDKKYGEEILAYIILKDGAQIGVEGIKDYVRANMARHKTPKYVLFTDSYPMTASGKVQKYKIRDLAIKEFDLYEDSAIETA